MAELEKTNDDPQMNLRGFQISFPDGHTEICDGKGVVKFKDLLSEAEVEKIQSGDWIASSALSLETQKTYRFHDGRTEVRLSSESFMPRSGTIKICEKLESS